MGKTLRRLMAGTLAFSMLLGQAAMASEALGWDLHAGSTALAGGTTLTRGYFWSDTYHDLRTERYITYTPSSQVMPTVAWGETLFTESTLTSMAQTLEGQGKRVVAGTNGDFYVVASGEPLGIVLSDGILRSSSPAYYYAAGFRHDGSAFITTADLQITATLNGERVKVSGGVNKTRRLTNNEGGLLLVTEDLGTMTKNSAAGVDVVLRPITEELGTVLPAAENGAGVDLTLTDQLQIGGRIRCLVEGVYESAGAIEIPEGCMILTMNGGDDEAVLAKLRALEVGMEVDVDVTAADPRWNEAVTAIGGLYRLLREGEVCEPPREGDATWTQQTARTAIGIKADGTVIFYTIDGWLSKNSVGASLTQVAKRLKELGCVEAISLDGGGSTTLGTTTAAQETMTVVNTPRDGAQRRVSNAIFLTTQAPATGVPFSLQLENEDVLLLAGSTIPLTTHRLDTTFRRMGLAENVTYTLAGEGTVGDGYFTASAQAGTVIITATEDLPEGIEWPDLSAPLAPVGTEPSADETSAPEGTELPADETPETELPETEIPEPLIPPSTLTGTATVTVVATPDAITLKNQWTGATIGSLTLSPGDVVSLTATSTWKNLPLRSSDGAYTWSCDPGVGTVDDWGTFTAGDATAAGELRITAGERTLTVPVNVWGEIKLLEDMEGDGPAITSTDTLQGTIETDLTKVHAGRRSLRLDYDVTEGEALLGLDLAIPAGERYIGLWVYGDGSGNTLTATFALPATRTEGEEPAPDEPYLPQTETVTLTALDFTGWRHVLVAMPHGAEALTGLGLTAGEETPATGRVWVDHLTTANEELEDATAPTLLLSVEGNTLTAQVSDNLDRGFGADQVWAQYDGKPLAGTWDGARGFFTATLPENDVGTHRITVIAQDQSGNLGRGSYDWTVIWTEPEPGTEEEPGTEPQPGTEGEGEAQPGVEPETEEPIFLDTEGHWAAAYADYLYEQGITYGVDTPEGLIYRPNTNISRVEFSVMVARWLGLDLSLYEDVELPFADLDQIPDWAIPAVKAMYAEGIMSGSLDGEVLNACPNDEISRVEVMTILGRTQQKGWTEADLTIFTDADKVPSWAEGYVRSLVGQGVINGFEDGTLGSSAPMSRGQVARVLYALR